MCTMLCPVCKTRPAREGRETCYGCEIAANIEKAPEVPNRANVHSKPQRVGIVVGNESLDWLMDAELRKRDEAIVRAQDEYAAAIAAIEKVRRLLQ